MKKFLGLPTPKLAIVKLLAVILVSALISQLLPIFVPGAAQAQASPAISPLGSFTPSVTSGNPTDGYGAEHPTAIALADTTKINFAGYEWVIIGWKGNGVAPLANAATLLMSDGNADDNKAGSSYFDKNTETVNNEYATSDLKIAYNNFATSMVSGSTQEGSMIISRDLTGGSGYGSSSLGPVNALSFAEAASGASATNYIVKGSVGAGTFDFYGYHTARVAGTVGAAAYTGTYHPDHVAGPDVNDQVVWPLSVAEAALLSPDVRAFNSHDSGSSSPTSAWCRTPGPSETSGAYIVNLTGTNYVTFSGITISTYKYSVRPAFYVNLQSVVMVSDATGENAKPSAPGSTLSQTGNLSDTTVVKKFTAKSSDIKLGSVTQTGQSGRTITFSYTGATPQIMLSAAVFASDGTVKYYGVLKADTGTDEGSGTTSGSASVTIPETIESTDTVKIFAEKRNAANPELYSDIISEPLTLTYTIDTTAPTLTSGTATDVGSNTAKINFTSNEAGTYYYLVYAASGDAPDSDTIKAQGSAVAKGTASAISGANSANVSGLNDSTSYKAYVIVEDAAGNISAITEIPFATTVPPDTTPPALSNGSVTGITLDSANLNFTSNEAGTYYYLVYNAADAEPDAATIKAQQTAVAKGSASLLDAANVAALTGLSESTQYKAYIIAVDAAGNTSAVTTLPFTTADPPDTTAPVLGSGTATDVSSNTAKISFSSDEVGTYYYLVYAASAGAPDSDTVKAQGSAVAKGTDSAINGINSANVSGLNDSTSYKAYVIVEDVMGNKSNVLEIAFTTLVPPDTKAPVLSEESATGLTRDSATLNFTSNEAGTYYYEVRDAKSDAPDAATIKALGNVATKGSGAAFNGANAVGVQGLQSGTSYKAYIVVVDDAGNTSDIKEIAFATLAGSADENDNDDNKDDNTNNDNTNDDNNNDNNANDNNTNGNDTGNDSGDNNADNNTNDNNTNSNDNNNTNSDTDSNTKNKSTKKTTAVNTSDDTKPVFWTMIAIISLLTIASLAKRKVVKGLAVILVTATVFRLLTVFVPEAAEAKAAGILIDDGISSVTPGAAVGDIVYFGHYPNSQLSDVTGLIKDEDYLEKTWVGGAYYWRYEPIEWRVLSISDGKAFLLADKVIDKLQYNLDATGLTWEVCMLRSWLNGYSTANTNGANIANTLGYDFISRAFTDKELALVQTSEVLNPNNPINTAISGGNTTYDKIFCLSIQEVENASYGFVGDATADSARKALPSSYAVDMNAYLTDGYSSWWLRSPGKTNYHPAVVKADGAVMEEGGNGTNWVQPSVRPAMVIDLSTVLYVSAATGDNAKPDGDGATMTSVSNTDPGDKLKFTFSSSDTSFLNIAVTDTSTRTAPQGGTVSIDYTGAITGSKKHVSAFIADASGNRLYYGKLVSIATDNASGTANITVPSTLPAGNYTINIFEERSDSYLGADFTSAAVAVPLTVTLLDTTPPTLSDGSVTGITVDSANLNFTSNEAGTYYYLIYNASEGEPGAATIKAQGTAVAKGSSEAIVGANSEAIKGLTAKTAYKAYVIVEDASGNISAVSAIAFNTLADETDNNNNNTNNDDTNDDDNKNDTDNSEDNTNDNTDNDADNNTDDNNDNTNNNDSTGDNTDSNNNDNTNSNSNSQKTDDKKTSSKTTKAVDTGDEGIPLTWTLLATVSAVMMIGLLKRKQGLR
jgi:hypothetical protein